MTLILGIESTCDETGAAVVRDGVEVLSNVVASQVELHAKYRGVVPEIASRAHIENLLPVLREAAGKAGVGLKDVDAVAVAHRPGLIGSLLVGVTAAKTLAWGLGKPLIGIDHVHAHLYSVRLGGPRVDQRLEDEIAACGKLPHPSFVSWDEARRASGAPAFPAVGLVCSGGHTAIYRLGSFLHVELVGSTIDDAVGEAYDKVAAILGLGYPGGPVIDRLARGGDARAIEFPRTMLERGSLDFSFSGLKTAVLYHVQGVPSKRQTKDQRKEQGERAARALSEKELADICASFQAACVDVIVKKLRRAVERFGAKSVIVGGGVSANRGLREGLTKLGVPFFVPELAYCTDNAAMSAGLAELYFREGRFSPLNLDAITHSQFSASI